MSQNEVAAKLSEICLERKVSIVTAESCTGGLIAKLLTDLAGSSAWFDRGFVTYSNQSKIDMLGVPEELLNSFGAVSEEVVRAMACGALTNSQADYSLAVSGIAGPTGGTAKKPVGFVCFAWAARHNGADETENFENTGIYRVESNSQHFSGSRSEVRIQASTYALQGLIKFVGIQ